MEEEHRTRQSGKVKSKEKDEAGQEAKRRRRMDEMTRSLFDQRKKEMYGKAKIKVKEKKEFL